MSQQPTDVSIWVGCDIGKGSHHVTVTRGDGGELFARSVRNDEGELDAVLDQVSALGVPALVIDQLGSLAQLVLAVALRRGVAVAYIPGRVMRQAASLYPGEAKTDARDSRVLADTGRLYRSRVRWVQLQDQLLAELRVLSGHDEDLAHDATRLINRLRDALTGVSPALERLLGPKLEQPAVRAVLTRYPTPSALRQAGRRRIEATWRAAGAHKTVAASEAIMTALGEQTVTVPTEAVVGRVIQELAADLDRVARRREVLERDLERLLRAHPTGPLLLSLPGVGVRIGGRLAVEIGDVRSFPTAAHLASYAGVAPVTKRSGTSINRELPNRRANRTLKQAMFLSAFCSLSYGPSRAYYTRKRKEGKTHTGAILCLARRRCDVIHAMLTQRRTFHRPASLPAA